MNLNFEKLRFWDISLAKMATLCGTLFLVAVWPQFASWVTSVHWAWFLGASLLFAIKPTMTVLRN